MEDATIILTFHHDTMELDIDAPTVPLDFAMSILDRAKRALENQEKILLAHKLREINQEEQRTQKVISRIKM